MPGRSGPRADQLAPLDQPLLRLTIHIIGRGLCGIEDTAFQHVRRSLFLCIFVLFSLALAFVVGEFYVKWQGWRDVDGTFYFRDRPIRSYVIPLNGA